MTFHCGSVTGSATSCIWAILGKGDPVAGPLGLYIHIPFCRSKCHYCDFNSYTGMQRLAEPYVGVLEREMELRAFQAAGRRAGTVFIGGGTPSVLPAPALAELLAAVRRHYDLAPDAEITVEANPGTVDAGKLAALIAGGANRLSMGAQTFDDAQLRRLGRGHRVEEVREAVELARAAGFDNINIDLIFGLPGQTLDGWRYDLEQAVALRPDHISAYALQVEEGTPFYQEWRAGTLNLPPDEETEAMFDLVRRFLPRNGYARYEISNYSLPGRECRHNMLYWHNEEYLGLGAGAVSCWGGRRWTNTCDPALYMQQVRDGAAWEEEGEAIERAAEMAETVFLGLRLTRGVSAERFQSRFGQTLADVYGPVIERLERSGLLEWDRGDAGAGASLRLTERGTEIGNRIFVEFLPAVAT